MCVPGLSSCARVRVRVCERVELGRLARPPCARMRVLVCVCQAFLRTYTCMSSCHAQGQLLLAPPSQPWSPGRGGLTPSMFGTWQWAGAGWWYRVDRRSGWQEWSRVGGYTPGEGGHRARAPREEGCILQLDLPFTANHLCRMAACPHTAYTSFCDELWARFGVRLRTPAYLSSSSSQQACV